MFPKLNSSSESFVSEARVTKSQLHMRFTDALWGEKLFAIVFFAAVLAFVYRDVVFGNRTFLVEGAEVGTMPMPLNGPYGYEGPRSRHIWDSGPVALDIEPWDQFIAQGYQQGQIPLWNLHQGLGIPLHANGLTGMFDPIKLITIYLVPMQYWPFAMDLHILVRFFLAGFFTYLFVRTLGVNLIGALASGVIYMLSTYFTMNGGISFVRLDTLLPLLLFSFHQLANSHSFQNICLSAFSVLMLILGDFPEHLPLHVGFAFLWYSLQTYFVTQNSSEKFKLWVRAWAYFGGATILAVLLGSFALLPFLQFFLGAVHFHSPDFLQTSIQKPWPLSALGGFLLPTIRWQTHFGPILLATAVLSILCIRQMSHSERYRRLAIYAAFFAGMFVLILLVTYRISIFAYIAQIPVINMIYLNRSTQPHLIFCIACLAGIGLGFIGSGTLQKVTLLSILASIIVTCIYAGAFLLDRIEFPEVHSMAVPISAVVFFSIVLFIAITKVLGKGNIPGTIAGIIITLLLIVDPSFAPAVVRPFRYNPYTPPPFVTYLQQVTKPFRIVGTDSILHANVATTYGIDDLRFIDAMYPARFYEFAQRFLVYPLPVPTWTSQTQFDGTTAPLRFDKAMDLLNVEYVLTLNGTQLQSAESGASPFELVHGSVEVDVYRNRNAYPRAFVVHSAEIISDFNAILDRFEAKDFDPSHSVILDQAPPDSFMMSLPSQAKPYEAAQVISRNSLEMTVQVVLASPGILVLSELSYPGWQAYVNGNEVPIYNAYGFMRAVLLERGTQLVQFHYRPPLFIVGLGVSGITLATLIRAGFWRYFSKLNGLSLARHGNAGDDISEFQADNVS